MQYSSKHNAASGRNGYLFALGTSTAVTAAGLPFRDMLHAENAAMLYLVGIALAAVYYGRAPAMLAAIVSAAAYNFFFTQPYYSFWIDSYRDIVATILLLITSIIIGSLAARIKAQSQFFESKEQATAALYALTHELAATRGQDNMLAVIRRHMEKAFGGVVTLWARHNDDMQCITHPERTNDIREKSAARYAFEHAQPAGLTTPTLPGVHGYYIPLKGSSEVLGVLGLIPTAPLSVDEKERLEVVASVTTSALERASASELAETRKVEAEAEKLRNMLLSSVSHDLRTPLASVRGSIEAVLASSKDSLSTESTELLEVARSQSERLTRMVNDLLAINRLETGKPLLDRQPYFIDEVIGAVIARAKPWLQGRTLKTDIARHLPLVSIDGALIEQVLINMLENAVKYTPADGSIHIAAEKRHDCLQISVSDNGCGIPKGENQKIFEKFYRVANNPAKEGSGLGLAICKAIIVAHGGAIRAENSRSGGLIVSFTLPLDNTLPSAEAEAGVE